MIAIGQSFAQSVQPMHFSSMMKKAMGGVRGAVGVAGSPVCGAGTNGQ
jgi:hypothetical protein